MTVQETIETIKTVIATAGPLTAREVETNPDVLHACRSSKTKARRHIERLVTLGQVSTDQVWPVARFWVS